MIKSNGGYRAFRRLCGIAGFFCFLAGQACAVKPLVFVSIPPQAWLLKEIAGDAVDVRTLMTSGANPHTFEPTGLQMKALEKASLYFTAGMSFEKTLLSAATALHPGLIVADMDAGIEKIADPDGDGGDPHVWLSPSLFCRMATNTVVALRKLTCSEDFGAGLDATVRKILKVDEEVRKELGACSSRTWAVYHPSWCYFARAYGLTLLEIEQEGKSPSARYLAQVIRKAKDAGVRVVFAEPQHDSRPSRLVAEAVGARVEILNPLEEDWPTLLHRAAAALR